MGEPGAEHAGPGDASTLRIPSHPPRPRPTRRRRVAAVAVLVVTVAGIWVVASRTQKAMWFLPVGHAARSRRAGEHRNEDPVPRTPTTSAVAALLGAVLVTGCVAGCGAPDPGPARADQPLSTATQAASATPSASTPTSGSTADDTDDDGPGQEETPFVPLDQAGEAPGSGSASIVGVRTGEHEGYERVVLDLAGEPEQVAGWFVRAVPQPLQDASGELLDVEGDRFLDLAVTGIANGSDGQVDSAGREAFVGAVGGTGGLVEQVWVGGAWEGQAQVLLGLDEAVREYRVMALSDPQRIVVDVR